MSFAQSQSLMVIGRDGGLSIMCHSCGFACHQRVLKTFTHIAYLCCKDGIVWVWHLYVSLHIYRPSFCLAMAQAKNLVMIGRNGGLSFLCHSWKFACIQRVIKTFPGSSYLCFEDGILWLWYLLLNLQICLSIYLSIYLSNIYNYIHIYYICTYMCMHV